MNAENASLMESLLKEMRQMNSTLEDIEQGLHENISPEGFDAVVKVKGVVSELKDEVARLNSELAIIKSEVSSVNEGIKDLAPCATAARIVLWLLGGIALLLYCLFHVAGKVH